ncbi:MAG: acyl-CoA thioesterase domain-containing protein [Sphingomicrobium sp.]
MPNPTLSSDLPPLDPWDGVDAVALIELEPAGDDRFTNRRSEVGPWDHLYGGQVLAQALAAATATAPGREVHSLHSYYLRAGSASGRVSFQVERTRDGARFSTRRVVASQGGKSIFQLDCSLRVPGLTAYDRQIAMPADIPAPETLRDFKQLKVDYADKLGTNGVWRLGLFPLIEARLIDPDMLNERSPVARRMMWVRVPGAAASDDPTIHAILLAYLSDHWLGGTALVTEEPSLHHDGPLVSSLDHSIWFHRPARVDNWLLYDMESPSASGATGFARGLLFDRSGRLIASVAQESLLQTPPKA